MEDLAKAVDKTQKDTKILISEAVDPLKSEFHSLKERVIKMESCPGSTQAADGALAQGVQQIEKALERRVKDMEKAIAELKVTPVFGAKDHSTAKVGGLSAWIEETMKKANIEGVISIYDKCKKEAFDGMVFIKFGTTEKRDAAIKTFNEKKHAFAEARTFMNIDLPLLQRTRFSFLLKLKRLLIEWKFENVSFDDAFNVSTVAGDPVLQVEVEGDEFKPKWLNKKWEQSGELTNDPSFKKLVKTAEDKLAAASQSKGKGKNPSA